MMDELVIDFLERVPKNLVSRGVGAVAEVPLPGPLQTAVNETFATAAGIDRDEARRSPDGYATLNALFTRRLRSDVRSIEARDERTVVSPVDGRLSKFGPIHDETLIQAKGREYRLLDLLDSGRHAAEFEEGTYATLYLSPQDYHRVHSPLRGEVTEVSYIPGELFPVFPMAVENVDELFCINERLISFLEVDGVGTAAVVMVGATCVGRMSLSYHPYQTNQWHRRRRVDRLDETVALDHGEELGVFNLGSTVVLLFSTPDFVFDDRMVEGMDLEMGRRLGRWGD